MLILIIQFIHILTDNEVMKMMNESNTTKDGHCDSLQLCFILFHKVNRDRVLLTLCFAPPLIPSFPWFLNEKNSIYSRQFISYGYFK